MKVTQTIISINSRELLGNAKKTSMNVIQSTLVSISVCTIKGKNQHCEFFEKKNKSQEKTLFGIDKLTNICRQKSKKIVLVDQFLVHEKGKSLISKEIFFF